MEDEDAEDKRGGAERKMRYERKEDKNYDEEAQEQGRARGGGKEKDVEI